MGREYFCAYHSYLEWMESLSDAEKGRLFVACLEYSKSGKEPELRGNEKVIFPAVRRQIDRDREVYEQKCERLRQNGAKGGKANGKHLLANGGQKGSKCPPREKGKGKTSANADKPAKAGRMILSPFEVAIEEFKEHRKKLRKPMTDRAVDLLLQDLERLAPGDEEKQIEIINQSIKNGWQGVFGLKNDRGSSEPEDRYSNLRRLYTMFAEEEASQ